MPGRYQFSLPERPQRDGWFRIGTLDVTTTAFIIMLAVASMFWYAIDRDSFYKLAFVPSAVRDGELWRLVTWPYINPPAFLVLLTLAFFWFVGHRVEDIVGRRRFAWLMLLITVLPAMAVTMLNFDDAVYGLAVPGLALLMVYAFDNPGAVSFFNIPLWVLAAAIVGVNVLGYLGNELYGSLVIELGGIIVGAFTVRQWGMLDDLAFIPRLGHKSGAKKQKKVKSRSTATVVEGPWGSAAPAMGGLNAIEQLELDQLLDKTSAMGLDSLSKAEKSRLNELSKKLRER